MPSASELEANGLTLEDFAGDVVEVWPENWQAFRLLERLQTQWRPGAAGVVGLDYGIAFNLMDRMGLQQQAFEEMLDDLRVMETAALTEINSKHT